MGHSIKHLPITPHNWQTHEKQAKSEELTQPRGAQEDMIARCHMGFCMESWNRDHEVKCKEIWIKYGL